MISKFEGKDGYTRISNNALQDGTLSAHAAQTLFYLLSLPEDWKIHANEIAEHFKWSRNTASKALRELAQKGYAHKIKLYEYHGKTVYDYLISSEKSAKNAQKLSTTNIYRRDNWKAWKKKCLEELNTVLQMGNKETVSKADISLKPIYDTGKVTPYLFYLYCMDYFHENPDSTVNDFLKDAIANFTFGEDDENGT